ncbi:MAG: DUF4136 domain-containing protein [Acidobacteriota bacterium]|nr:DUF4136 domain-containing protein [Acidobacteriota bacterium]
MNRPIFGFVILIGLLTSLAACGPSIKVSAAFDSDQDFSRYKSFDWLKPKSGNDDPMEKNPIIAGKVKQAITAALEAKGYQAGSGDGDLHVVFYGSSKDKLQIRTWTEPYYGYGYRGWAYGWGETRTTVDEYEEGRLVIDFIDAKTNQLVYRAHGTGRVNESDRNIDARVQRAVDKILKSFPPQ